MNAVIYEAGHAKLIEGKTGAQIEALYEELMGKNIMGISQIAEMDGAEALAEINVLKHRDEDIGEEAERFYETYMKERNL